MEFNNNSTQTRDRNSLNALRLPTDEEVVGNDSDDGDSLNHVIDERLMRLSGAKDHGGLESSSAKKRPCEKRSDNSQDVGDKMAARHEDKDDNLSENGDDDESSDGNEAVCRDSQVLEDFAVKMMQTVDIDATNTKSNKTARHNEDAAKTKKQRNGNNSHNRSNVSPASAEKLSTGSVDYRVAGPTANVDVRSKVMSFGEPVNRLRNGTVSSGGGGGRKISYRDSGPYENVPDHERRMVVLDGGGDEAAEKPSSSSDAAYRKVKPAPGDAVKDDDLGAHSTGKAFTLMSLPVQSQNTIFQIPRFY